MSFVLYHRLHYTMFLNESATVSSVRWTLGQRLSPAPVVSTILHVVQPERMLWPGEKLVLAPSAELQYTLCRRGGPLPLN